MPLIMGSISERLLLDIGSSTVKVYKYSIGKAELFLSRSIPFKEDFNPATGISQKNKTELYELIKELKDKHPDVSIKTYATALFRKIEPIARTCFVDEFFDRTGLFFNIIEHSLDNFYLQVALVGKYPKDKPVLLINVGGGSTELVVMYGKEAIETKNIELGVGTVLTKFCEINSDNPNVALTDLISDIKASLPDLDNTVDIAFYTGGELKYMELVRYPLHTNDLFKDDDHPKLISLIDFSEKNKEVFSKIKLCDLETLMPDNPKWMHGAKPCSALAQAICEKYGIKTIIPSNSNLVDGAVRQEFRHVTLSGSFRKHLEYILGVRKGLVEKGVEVLSPRFVEPKNPGGEFVVFTGEEGLTPLELERHHLNSIKNSDALIVCDKDGYVGASALIEIGLANALGKRIIFTEKPEEFMLNTLPAEVNL